MFTSFLWFAEKKKKKTKKNPKNIYSVQTYLFSLPLNSTALLVWLLITHIRHSILQEELATSILKAASNKQRESAISQSDKETSESLTDFFSSVVAGNADSADQGLHLPLRRHLKAQRVKFGLISDFCIGKSFTYCPLILSVHSQHKTSNLVFLPKNSSYT